MSSPESPWRPSGFRRIEVRRSSAVSTGFKAERARGLFNVEEEDGASFSMTATLPELDDDWRVGVVVGSSGSGKSTLGQEISKEWGFLEWKPRWSKTEPIIDSVGSSNTSFDQVTAVLSSVGLGSVPAWLRPYAVLSNGEKFRADCAAALLRGPTAMIVDEFTSVLDRQVAQVGAAAFARAWRKQKRKVILLTCHHDVLNFVEPDWVFDTDRQTLFQQELAAADTIEASRWPEVGRLVIQR